MSEVFQPTTDDIQILERECGFKGFYQLDVLNLRHRHFDGSLGPVLERELFTRPNTVCVLPYDPELDVVVLIEQFRIGAIEKGPSSWLLEAVAGLIDTAEEPEVVARREAKEEADLELKEILPITVYYPTPGCSDEQVCLYLGNCDASQAGGIYGLDEEGEDIKVHVWPLSQAREALQSGQINNAATIIALQWLLLNYNEVRQAWQ